MRQPGITADHIGVRKTGRPRKYQPDLARLIRELAPRPASCTAYSPAHEARVAAHAERVAAETPTGDGVECWACGTPAPCRTWPERLGWAARWCQPAGQRELYCESCFAEWGWGDD